LAKKREGGGVGGIWVNFGRLGYQGVGHFLLKPQRGRVVKGRLNYLDKLGVYRKGYNSLGPLKKDCIYPQTFFGKFWVGKSWRGLI